MFFGGDFGWKRGVSTLLHVIINDKSILKTAGVNFSFLAQLGQNLQAIKGC